MLERTEVYAWLICAALCGVIVLAWWLTRPAGARHPFPLQRSRAVPWSGFEVLLVFFLYYAVWTMAIHELLEASGFLTWLYQAPPPEMTPESLAKPAVRIALTRRLLWADALSVPFNVAGVLLLLGRMSGTRPYQLGWTGSRWWWNVVAGCLVWPVLTITVDVAQILTMVAYEALTHGGERAEHPFLTLAQTGGVLPVEWALLTFVTVIGAPLVEELLFRGVLQRWACQHPLGGNATMLAAVVWGGVALANGHGIGPLIFVLVMLPVYVFIEHLLWRWLPRPDVARGIFATALLFGVAHSFAWPDPVPLTVLGLGLGWLAYRTQSLVGPMVVHGIFNGTTMIALALQASS